MNDNITLKEPNTREFNLAFDNFWFLILKYE